MTFRLSERDFADAIGRRLGQVLGPQSIKEIQAAAGHVSPPTASNFRRGLLPDVFEPFFQLLGNAGPATAREVLAPLIGEAAQLARAERLAKVESQLDDLAQTIAELRTTNREGLCGLRALLRFRSADGPGLADDEGGGGVDAGGEDLPGYGEADRVSSRLKVRRRTLSVIDGGNASHLGRELARWKASGGTAERDALVEQARHAPERRLAIVSDAGASLVFEHISPAFRLYTEADRARLIGRPTTEAPDLAYARACDANTRGVIEAGAPQVDDVSAVIRAGDVSLAIDYRRLVLPYSDGRRRFALCASEPLAEAA